LALVFGTETYPVPMAGLPGKPAACTALVTGLRRVEAPLRGPARWVPAALSLVAVAFGYPLLRGRPRRA
jgi:hypothetical protein